LSYLFDTNVVSELRRPDRAHPAVVRWSSSVAEHDVFISTITILELEKGTLRAERNAPDLGVVLRRWMNTRVHPTYGSRTLDVTTEIALSAAAFDGLPTVELADHLIAATALVHDLILVTRNVRDFGGTGVRLLNPWDA
jgi:predicted nucleic acid-binding protein